MLFFTFSRRTSTQSVSLKRACLRTTMWRTRPCCTVRASRVARGTSASTAMARSWRATGSRRPKVPPTSFPRSSKVSFSHVLFSTNTNLYANKPKCHNAHIIVWRSSHLVAMVTCIFPFPQLPCIRNLRCTSSSPSRARLERQQRHRTRRRTNATGRKDPTPPYNTGRVRGRGRRNSKNSNNSRNSISHHAPWQQVLRFWEVSWWDLREENPTSSFLLIQHELPQPRHYTFTLGFPSMQQSCGTRWPPFTHFDITSHLLMLLH